MRKQLAARPTIKNGRNFFELKIDCILGAKGDLLPADDFGNVAGAKPTNSFERLWGDGYPEVDQPGDEKVPGIPARVLDGIEIGGKKAWRLGGMIFGTDAIYVDRQTWNDLATQ
jgi:hypothetical protein